jgi:hypothetical protein
VAVAQARNRYLPAPIRDLTLEILRLIQNNKTKSRAFHDSGYAKSVDSTQCSPDDRATKIPFTFSGRGHLYHDFKRRRQWRAEGVAHSTSLTHIP